MEVASRNQSGISIVEALVAMVILLITLGGVYQIFQSNSLTYRMQEGLARVQENGRFAMDFLVNDIRMAGYRGCVGGVDIKNTLNNSTEHLYNFNVGVEGFNSIDTIIYPLDNKFGTWQNNDENNITNQVISSRIGTDNVLRGSDIIAIRKSDTNGIKVTKHPFNPNKEEDEEAGSADIQVDTGNGFSQFEILLVTDCIAAAVFQISSANPNTSGNIAHNTGVGTPGNSMRALGKEYTGGEVVRIYTNTFFIDKNISEIPSLYKKQGTDDAQELVEGIENMQILYGEDTNQDRNVDTYVNATSVTDWDNVRSVKIGLLVSTVDEIRGMEENTESYNVLGTTVGPANDRRIRRVFTATVGLRNRLK